MSGDSKSIIEANTLGSQTSDAPASTLNVDGYKSNQSIIINQELTDGGTLAIASEAIDVTETLGLEAFGFADDFTGEILDAAGGFAADVIATNTDTMRNAFDSNELAMAESFGFGRDALRSNEIVSGQAFDLGSDSIYALERTAVSVIDMAEELNHQNTNFMGDAFSELRSNTESVVGSIVDLEESRVFETGRVLETVGKLAEVVNTGGESISANINKVVMVASIIVVGFIGWQAVKYSK